MTLPDTGDAALDDIDATVRALFQLQSHALKAAHARIDSLEQQQADRGHRGSHDAGVARTAPSPVPQSHNPAHAATVASIGPPNMSWNPPAAKALATPYGTQRSSFH